MKVFKFLFIFVLICQTSKSYSEDHNGILNYLKESDKYSYFFKLIKKANYEKLFMKEAKYKKVLYIPDNDAFDRLPLRLQKYIWDETDNEAAKKIIKTHLYTGSIKQVFKDPNKKVVIVERLELNGEKVKIYSNNDLFVKDMVNKNKAIIKDNIKIIPVSCVMYLQPSYSDDRLSALEKRESFVTSCCMLSDEEIDSFMKGDTI
tara:strand:+ start:1563 stop:2174 length:612 start_codon:yes stop_codon:yes gene_type:complete